MRRARPMAKVSIRYFVTRPGAQGPRHFWQPSSALRAQGWSNLRLSDTRRVAIDQAIERNEVLDAWYKAGGEAVPPAALLAARAGTLPHAELLRLAPAPRSEPVTPGTLKAVIVSYQASRFFTQLRPRSQRAYRQNIAHLEAWGGDVAVRALGPQRVEKLYASLLKTPAKAKAVIVMLQILLKHAIHLELIATNPAASASLQGSKPSGKIWPRAAIAEFVAEADTAGYPSIGTAVLLNHWIGQREEDILALPLSGRRDGRFTIDQLKTNSRVRIKDNPVVRARIEAELQRQAERRHELSISPFAGDRRRAKVVSTTLLLSETALAPWHEDHFRHCFGEIRASLAARIPAFAQGDGTMVRTTELLFRHLRHTAVTELALAGCTAIEIAAITGHSLKTVNAILERYLVLTSELADHAMDKRSAWDAAREQGDQSA